MSTFISIVTFPSTDAMMLGKLLQDPTMDLRVWKVKAESTLLDLKQPLLEVSGLGITQVKKTNKLKTH